MTYLEGAVLRNHWLEVGAAAQDESMRLPFLFATDHCKIGISTALQNAFDMELARTQIMGSIAEVPPQVRVKALFAHRNTCGLYVGRFRSRCTRGSIRLVGHLGGIRCL